MNQPLVDYERLSFSDSLGDMFAMMILKDGFKLKKYEKGHFYS